MIRAKVRDLILSPLSVTFVVALFFLGAVLVSSGGNPLEFARLGTRFSEQVSSGTEGYDGQFVYYLAVDPNPSTVAVHLDVPAYRYQRILLPLLARIFSFGRLDWIPWAIPIVGLAAHLWAVYLLSKLFEGWGVSRWYALGYGLWVGLLFALRVDLPEPLAFSLVVTAIWLEQRRYTFWGWLCFALSLFAKETTIFFVLALGLAYLARRRWRDVAGLAFLAGLPFALFHLWLAQVYGNVGFGTGWTGFSTVDLIPYHGLWGVAVFNRVYFLALLIVFLPPILLPALWGLFSSIKRWHGGQIDFISTALFLNAAIYPFLPLPVYIEHLGMLRLASGLVLALLLYVAKHRERRALNYSLFWIVLDILLVGQLFG